MALRTLMLSMLGLGLATPAEAQREPIAVVVETTDPSVRATDLRAKLAEALGAPVAELGTRPESSVVVVQLGPSGPAHVRIHARGRTRRSLIERGSGDWLVAGLVTAMRGASLVDWDGQTRVTPAPPLAQWEEPPPAPPRVESGAALDPPPR